MDKKNCNVALIGNPNSGKTTLFNLLTGLNFKTGNFPGVTIEKRVGKFEYKGKEVTLIDLPGTYSLHPNTLEEAVNLNYFINQTGKHYPDLILFIADTMCLRQHLLLFDQLKETGIPIILVLNMTDTAKKQGIQIDVSNMEKELGVDIVRISARTKEGIEILKNKIIEICSKKGAYTKPNKFTTPLNAELQKEIEQQTGCKNSYLCLLASEHRKFISDDLMDQTLKSKMDAYYSEKGINPLERQIDETMTRFRFLEPIVDKYVIKRFSHLESTEKIDRILTHKIWGPIIFLLITFIVFQAVFSLASIPMEWINMGFSKLSDYLANVLPDGGFVDLLTQGILPGINGVLVFVPQIAIMFFFIVLLEESGYLARVVYMFDGIMRRFGMNGRSLVSLISSSACAIPAVMSTRTIKNRKQRLITIFVAPFMSCSARIPVYTMLLALIVPNIYVMKFIHLQGLAFFGLYIIGAFFAFFVAFLLNKIMKSEERGYLIISLPEYRLPHWRSIVNEVYDKVGSFVREAGRIILVISVVLWFAANTMMPGQLERVNERIEEKLSTGSISPDEKESILASMKLEASLAGQFGKWIEPAIKPLGYDWKIGIALLTSFAAREVFVGTLSTIYSVEEQDSQGLIKKMREAKNPETGKPVFTLATAASLLVFYILAMQCMSTLAVVRKETLSWKWPVLQFVVMTGLAYIMSFIIYNVLA